MLRAWPDGRIKLFVTQRLLRLRRDHAELFLHGSYVPLDRHRHTRRFLRRLRPRTRWRMARRRGSTHFVTGRLSANRDSLAGHRVELPEGTIGAAAVDIFTGQELQLNNHALKVADAMATLPVAVYRSERLTTS